MPEKLIRFCCGRAMKALQAMKNFQFLRTGRRETLSTEDSEKMKEAAGWYKKQLQPVMLTHQPFWPRSIFIMEMYWE